MATELERLTALKSAGVASEADLKRLAELGKVPATSGDEQWEVLASVDTEAEETYRTSGEYTLAKAGFMKSVIVATKEPQTKTTQKWLILESADSFKGKGGIEKKNRGIVILTFSGGIGISHQALDALEIPNKVENGKMSWIPPKLPMVCYAEWANDPKAIGEVRISGLKTEAAGAAIKQTL